MTSAIHVPFSVRGPRTVRIVNLNNRYKLGKDGFKIGLHFKSPQAYNACRHYLSSKYDSGWSRWSRVSTPEECRWGFYTNTPRSDYWIGIRDEATLTMILLGVSELGNRRVVDERKKTS